MTMQSIIEQWAKGRTMIIEFPDNVGLANGGEDRAGVLAGLVNRWVDVTFVDSETPPRLLTVKAVDMEDDDYPDEWTVEFMDTITRERLYVPVRRIEHVEVL